MSIGQLPQSSSPNPFCRSYTEPAKRFCRNTPSVTSTLPRVASLYTRHTKHHLPLSRTTSVQECQKKPVVYREWLKKRKFGKEAPQNFCSEQAPIALSQGASENKNFEEKPTEPKTDSSITSGIKMLQEIEACIQRLTKPRTISQPSLHLRATIKKTELEMVALTERLAKPNISLSQEDIQKILYTYRREKKNTALDVTPSFVERLSVKKQPLKSDPVTRQNTAVPDFVARLTPKTCLKPLIKKKIAFERLEKAAEFFLKTIKTCEAPPILFTRSASAIAIPQHIQNLPGIATAKKTT